MFKVSDIRTTPPAEFSTHLQEKVYASFAALKYFGIMLQKHYVCRT